MASMRGMSVNFTGLAQRLPRRKVTWRKGTKGKLSGKFSWVRVWPAQGWQRGACAFAASHWLLIEEQADGQLKYAFSNLPAESPMDEGVAYWKSRWPVEQGYQQMKEELGLDHFEGRSWRGFHHHACLVMLAFGFLAQERHDTAEGMMRPGEPSEGAGDETGAAGKKGGLRRSPCPGFAGPCSG
jgi:SRSO17 transposase